MDEDDYLLDEWGASVENFLLWIEKVCKVEKDSITYYTLKENVVNMNELLHWINFFRGNIDEIEFITVLYMKNKFVET